MTELGVPLPADARSFRGPEGQAQLREVFATIRECLPDFAASVMREGVEIENGLNEQLALFASSRFYVTGLPYCAQRESMEDETRGNSPSVDIGIHLYVRDTALKPPRLTILEGKRLDEGIEARRRREYVVGRDKPYGGMERFKKGIHGRGIAGAAGMIGYVQTADFAAWHARINTWIAELAREPGHTPPWRESERLPPLEIDGIAATCESTLTRADDSLSLVHLWVTLVVSSSQ